MNDSIIKVGVGLLVIKHGKVLWSKRKGSHGSGQYGGIGGHVEYGETLEQAILREVAEECGITVKNLRLLCVSDFLTHSPKHYVDIGFTAEWESGEPQILEPHRCDGWEWRDIDDIPANIFAPMAGYIQAYKTDKKYFTYPADAAS